MASSRMASRVVRCSIACAAVLTLGACAEVELDDEQLGDEEVEAFVEVGEHVSQELIKRSSYPDIICRDISCPGGQTVRYCFYPPRNPSTDEMCRRISRTSADDGTTEPGADARQQ